MGERYERKPTVVLAALCPQAWAGTAVRDSSRQNRHRSALLGAFQLTQIARVDPDEATDAECRQTSCSDETSDGALAHL